MADPQIASFSLNDLIAKPDRLSAFEDPDTYLKESGPRFVEFIAANPRSAGDDIVLVLTVVDGKIVGSLSAIAIALKIGGETYRSTALRAFFLDGAWRNSGSGGLMLLRILSSVRSAIASGAPDEDATNLYRGVGFQELGPLSRFVYFHSTRPLIHTATRGWLPGASGFAALADPAARLYYRFRAPSSPFALEFRPASRFPEGLDTLLTARRDDHTVRLAADLNWLLKYSDSLAAYEILKGGRLAGYCLFYFEARKAVAVPRPLPAMRVASLLDFYLEDESLPDFGEVVSFAISRSRQEGVDVLEIQSNQSEVIRILNQFGFVRAGGNRVLLRPPRGIVLDRDSWRLTQGEGDVVFAGLSGMRATGTMDAD